MDTPTLHVNPLAPLGRSWRRLRRRPVAMQVRTILLILAVIVGLVLWIDLAPSSDGGAGAAGAAEVASQPTPVSQASTSTRGVTANSINVVFPIVNLNSEAGKLGFAEDAMSSMSADFHQFPVQNIFPIMGRVRSSAEITEALKGA